VVDPTPRSLVTNHLEDIVMLHHRSFLASLVAVTLIACGGDPDLVRSYASGSLPSLAAAARHLESNDQTIQYGPAVKVGEGIARTYVVSDPKGGDAPLELGVALSEGAMNGLPAKNPHAAHAAAKSAHEHLDNHVYLLSLPARGVEPYKFVELDWNPGGHEPPGIYDQPHFDFHFYTISLEERAAIVPSDPQFQQKADMLPAESQRPPFYAMAAPPGAPAPGVPLMGVHWIDVRSPELQKMMGKPELYRPFTTTFIYGSWAGRFTFVEPMITRDHILAKRVAIDPAVRNEEISVPVAMDYSPAGYYPAAYRITWNAQAKEYRIALTQLAMRE
jgi:hypothetical protein